MGSEQGRVVGAPRPGDPRSEGPRPPGGWRDVAWSALAAALVLVTTVQLGRVAWVTTTDPDVTPNGAGLFLAFLVTVVWLVTVTWLTLGSWRRSVWGCPFEHTTDAAAERRCPRHGVVTPAAVDRIQPIEPPRVAPPSED